jgi:phosphoribosyl 1,2-cyclic phosphodiesterase
MGCSRLNLLLGELGAISDAGGLAGFVREVIGEAKRYTMQTARDPRTLANPRAVRIQLESYAAVIAHRRLGPGLDRGVRVRLGLALIHCTDAQHLDADIAQALDGARAWRDAVMQAVSEALAPMIHDVRDQLATAPAQADPNTTEPRPQR